MTMKICNKCGEFNSVASIICANCGNVLNNVAVIDQGNDYVKCPKCGASIAKKLLMCPECGEVITKKISNKKKSNWVMYIFSLFIPVVGVIIGSMMLAKNDGEKKAVGTTCLTLGMISIVYFLLAFYLL